MSPAARPGSSPKPWAVCTGPGLPSRSPTCTVRSRPEVPRLAGTRIHSIRLPGFVVTTEVVFGGSGERLVMRHDPGSTADPYVAGTLLAIRRVADEPGLRRGLASLLYGDPDADR
ncbi:dihydrodipicolinate reductase C-terminal domain-containing protein [Kribbella sp. NBC_01510]|uniref:dihydrodipicolinate reductase C-terminal domain-containing protein n=1 Tax=Kribbella sp. NBC_01510 TaxID=2903581 RepID=UPI00386FE147